MEQELVQIAIDNLEKTTGTKAFWHRQGPLDGALKLRMDDLELRFQVEVMREVRTHQLPQIEQNFHRHEDFMIVARHIFPKIRQELRQKEIPYLEASGNVYLKREGIYVFVDTQKAIPLEKNTGNRAFTKTGLKVLFYLLRHKDALKLTQREIAAKTGVALGNIPLVLDGLKETGYLIPVNKKEYAWANRYELLNRWINEYATTLRPTLKKGRYKLGRNWKEIQFLQTKTVWGGEPAADMLTNYLRPEEFVLYTLEDRKELIKIYGLIPQKEGEVEVLEMFWKDHDTATAPPLLVYTDLMLEGGKRNKETAMNIFDEYIRPII